MLPADGGDLTDMVSSVDEMKASPLGDVEGTESEVGQAGRGGEVTFGSLQTARPWWREPC